MTAGQITARRSQLPGYIKHTPPSSTTNAISRNTTSIRSSTNSSNANQRDTTFV